VEVKSPLVECRAAPSSAACAEVFRALKRSLLHRRPSRFDANSGWADAWTSAPSVYAVAGRKYRNVVAAVNFARRHNLRLVVKGGGHSYQALLARPIPCSFGRGRCTKSLCMMPSLPGAARDGSLRNPPSPSEPVPSGCTPTMR